MPVLLPLLTAHWLIASEATAPPLPVVKVHQADGVFKLDGNLNETFWKDATPYSGLVPVGRKEVYTSSNDETNFKVVLHQSKLVIGIRCSQAKSDILVRTRERGNPSVCADDSVEIFISPSEEGFYQLAVNAEGYIFDQWVTSGGTVRQKWNGAWEAMVIQGEDGWTAEIAIPLVALNRHEKASGLVWKLNVARNQSRAKVYRSWARVTRSYAEVQQHGHMELPPNTTLPIMLRASDASFPDLRVGVNRFAIEATAPPHATYLLKTSFRKWKPGPLPPRSKHSEMVAASPEGKVIIPLETEVLEAAALHELVVELADPDKDQAVFLTAHAFRAPEVLSMSKSWPVYFSSDNALSLMTKLHVAELKCLEGMLDLKVLDQNNMEVHRQNRPLERADCYEFTVPISDLQTGAYKTVLTVKSEGIGEHQLTDAFYYIASASKGKKSADSQLAKD